MKRVREWREEEQAEKKPKLTQQQLEFFESHKDVWNHILGFCICQSQIMLLTVNSNINECVLNSKHFLCSYMLSYIHPKSQFIQQYALPPTDEFTLSLIADLFPHFDPSVSLSRLEDYCCRDDRSDGEYLCMFILRFNFQLVHHERLEYKFQTLNHVIDQMRELWFLPRIFHPNIKEVVERWHALRPYSECWISVQTATGLQSWVNHYTSNFTSFFKTMPEFSLDIDTGNELYRTFSLHVRLMCINNCREMQTAVWHLSNALDNREIILAAVKRWSQLLEFASDRLKDDRELVLEAIQNDNSEASVVQYISRRLTDDRELMLAAIEQNNTAYNHISPALKNDHDFALQAARVNGFVLLCLPKCFASDRDIILAAVRSDGMVLSCVNEEFKDDREIVFEAVTTSGAALQHASARLKDDHQIVLTAMLQNPFLLAYASIRLQQDEDLLCLVQKSFM